MTRRGPLLLFALVVQAAEPGYVGSAACSRCHRSIAESYRKTAMARSAGVTTSGPETFARASFTRKGTRYQALRNQAGLSFQFGTARKALPFFIGSGAMARSYLIADEGWLFEAPVAYYATGAKWDLAPRFDAYDYPYLTRPAMPGCLGCHSSFINVEPGTQNRYAAQPFDEGGVACERCHGPGEAHAAGRGPIVNPAKLEPSHRDSVCSQCHLSGEVRVRAAGAGWNTYRPGDKLVDSIKVFVRAGTNSAMTVTGHTEKLATSACKKASGERLWCGTCHDPHTQPTAKAIAARCLQCHQAKDCPQPKSNQDCTACHMPKNPVRDAQHVVYTDHSIPRRPRAAVMSSGGEVVPFEGTASSRDVALAYAIAGDNARALPLLQQAPQDDPEILMYLAELYRNSNRLDAAVPLYERAIKLDAQQVTASVGLGSIMMERHRDAEAIRLWEDALAKNAGLVMVRTNLAMAYWRSGDTASAERHLRRTLVLSPAFAPAANLLKQIQK